jgi:hypothetical protein
MELTSKPAPSSRLEIRPRSQRVWAATAGLVSLVFLAVATAGGGGPAAWVLAAILALLAWRYWVIGIVADAAGLRVVSILRSRTASWSDVRNISIDRFRFAPLAVGVELDSGEVLTTEALVLSGQFVDRKRQRLEQLAAPLIELFEQHRTKEPKSSKKPQAPAEAPAPPD